MPDALISSQPSQFDSVYYRNAISAPLKVDTIMRGSLIITSSDSDQFIKEVHIAIVQQIALLISQVLQFYVAEDTYAQERDSATQSFRERNGQGE